MPRKKNQLAVISPSMSDSVFGPAPILESEDAESYKTFLEGVIAIVRPKDVIEQMWTRQIVDLKWEIRYYGELKVHVIKTATPKALEAILAPLTDGPWRFGALDVYDKNGALQPRPSMELANDYTRGDEEGIEEINETLRKANLTMKDVKLHAMDLAMDKLDRINQVMSRLEVRCNGLLGEIERRRKTLAADLRRATDTVDGEFEEIESEAA